MNDEYKDAYTDYTQLEIQISLAQDAYYNSTPIMSDVEYDALIERLRQYNPNHELLKKVGAKPKQDSRLQKVKHKIRMGSLNKVVSKKEFDKWADKINTNDLILQDKLDGLSVEIIYDKGEFVQASTRGDGTTGEDISHNIKTIIGEKLPIEFSGSLRGEVFFELSMFESDVATSGYSNPRNAASGIARKKDSSPFAEYLKIRYFDCICDQSFDTEIEKLTHINKTLNFPVVRTLSGNRDKVWNVFEKCKNEDRGKLNYEIDGMVVKTNSIKMQEELGELNGRPKWAIAIKFPSDIAETEVKEIKWEVGKTGRVTPVAILRPMKIGGVIVSKASLHNKNIVKTLGIRSNAKVIVSRRGDVIPYIERVIEKGEDVYIPDCCPICDIELVEEGEFLICKNSICPAKPFGDIKKWIESTEMDDLGDEFVRVCLNKKLIEDAADLYKLNENDLLKLDRFQEKKAKKIINRIQSKKTLSLAIFMKALNIPNIGERTFQLLINAGYDTVEKLINLIAAEDKAYKDLKSIKGVGDKTIDMLIEGLQTRREYINKLLQYIKIEKKAEGKLSGKSFCFTGPLEIKRSDAQKLVKSLGGDIKTSVSKDLTYLVQANPNSISTKSQKAKKYRTKILSENEFMDIVNFSIGKLNEKN